MGRLNFEFSGALGRNRTCDLRFRKPLLYPLSYEGNLLELMALRSLSRLLARLHATEVPRLLVLPGST